MSVVDRDGVRISFGDSGSGPPVVLMHSFLCNGEMWQGQVRRLGGANRVINIDLRGHGKFSPKLIADEMQRFMGSVQW